jgi:hypothetical protein
MITRQSINLYRFPCRQASEQQPVALYTQLTVKMKKTYMDRKEDRIPSRFEMLICLASRATISRKIEAAEWATRWLTGLLSSLDEQSLVHPP